jgi:hypothetical protein
MGAHMTLAEFPAWRAMLAAGVVRGLYLTAIMLALAAVAFCLVRGVPVIVEGARFFGKSWALPKAG